MEIFDPHWGQFPPQVEIKENHLVPIQAEAAIYKIGLEPKKPLVYGFWGFSLSHNTKSDFIFFKQ